MYEISCSTSYIRSPAPTVALEDHCHMKPYYRLINTTRLLAKITADTDNGISRECGPLALQIGLFIFTGGFSASLL